MALRRIRIPNPKLSEGERTYLDADYTSGTSLTVLSTLNIEDNDIAVVGNVGDELTEQEDVTAISGSTTITLSAALDFDHNKGTPIYVSEWDQVDIERNDGSGFSRIILIDIQWDKLETIYTDTNGTSTATYRFRFYNSAAQVSSEYSPTISGGGFDRNQVGAMVLNVRKKIRDPNREKISDSYIIQLLGDAQTTISGVRHDWWFLKVDTFELATPIAAVASQRRYDLDAYSNFNYLHRIRYHFQPSTNNLLYDLRPKPDEEFDRFMQDRDATNNDNVIYYKQSPPDTNSDIGYFVVYPVPATATGNFYPIYFKKMNTLDDISDETNIPFPEVLEDYASWILHDELGNKEEADRYRRRFFGTPVRGILKQEITGLGLLQTYQKNRNMPTNHPRTLWRYRGRGQARNYYGEGLVGSDYYKENYWDPN